MQQQGRFISVEGGEGVGKSFFTSALLSRLQQAEINVVSTREPGGTPTAQAIRELFMSPPENDPLDSKAELFLVSAARCQHLAKLILPSLAAGRWVLCDRFHDSSRVYQGLGGGVAEEDLEKLIQLSVGQNDPDLTFVLDCDVDTALARVKDRETVESESGNRYDEASRAFHETLRKGFLSIAKRFPERVMVLDASQSPEQVQEAAAQEIFKRFGLKI